MWRHCWITSLSSINAQTTNESNGVHPFHLPMQIAKRKKLSTHVNELLWHYALLSDQSLSAVPAKFKWNHVTTSNYFWHLAMQAQDINPRMAWCYANACWQDSSDRHVLQAWPSGCLEIKQSHDEIHLWHHPENDAWIFLIMSFKHFLQFCLQDILPCFPQNKLCLHSNDCVDVCNYNSSCYDL